MVMNKDIIKRLENDIQELKDGMQQVAANSQGIK
jgi:hypothetical protein